MTITAGSSSPFSNGEKVSDTTLIISSVAASVGDWIFLGIVVDNLSASTPTISSITTQVGETNTWTVVTQNSPQATGGAGAMTYLAYLKATVAWVAVNTTVTLSGSVTAKAGIFQSLVGVGGAFIRSGSSATGATSMTLTGVVDGDLAVQVIATEDATAPTTSASNWTNTVLSDVTTGGGAASNVGVSLYWQEMAAGVPTQYGGTNTDAGQIYVLVAGAAAATGDRILVQPPRRP